MGEPLPSTTVWGLRVVRFAFVMDLARRADTRTLAMQTGTSDRDEAIGIIRRFLDEDVEAIRAEAREQGARDQVDRLAEAHDALGGMYSWNDAYLDDERNAHLWTVRAGRILREIVGRPARPPDPEP